MIVLKRDRDSSSQGFLQGLIEGCGPHRDDLSANCLDFYPDYLDLDFTHQSWLVNWVQKNKFYDIEFTEVI